MQINNNYVDSYSVSVICMCISVLHAVQYTCVCTVVLMEHVHICAHKITSSNYVYNDLYTACIVQNFCRAKFLQIGIIYMRNCVSRLANFHECCPIHKNFAQQQFCANYIVYPAKNCSTRIKKNYRS